MSAHWLKFARFVVVGGFNAVVYFGSTYFYVVGLGLGSNVASVLGFLTAVPLAFVAHRSFTFASKGPIGGEWGRFVVAQIASLATSLLAMWITVDVLGGHFAYGIVAGIVFVPIMTFVVLNRLVFRQQPARAGMFSAGH
jgi:putative flippase GtrA